MLVILTGKKVEDLYPVPRCFGEFGDRFCLSRKCIPDIQQRQKMAEETKKGKVKRRDTVRAQSPRPGNLISNKPLCKHLDGTGEYSK